ncbi:potassium channel family protein [Aestuariibaculum sediminum]|uniref:Two pore domain potassium channel family protein n=1 Tax=Aestuariibaculum sediminum TaxID=2770637 RepID=A0A8J6Q0P0_9FLAO|nr:potassium channel family protein [Aestuariibaculum sediminum]MBD0830635.1 two pore domain potassium channel family protein [Aestuariibaculum sediminum]
MIAFFINILRLGRIFYRGIKHDSEFRFLLVFILLLLTGSSLFYIQIEQWSPLDAIYFSVMTMATVGYGDLVPTTNLGKIFTMVYTFLAIGTFVAFTAKIVTILFYNRIKKPLNKKSD